MSKLFFAAVLFLSSSSFAQLTFLYSSVGQEYGKANCVDKDTNYIEAALFQNTINVNPNGTTTLTSNGMVDVVVAKYNKKGNLLWGKRFGGISTTDAPHGVSTDAQGNIYVAGYFGNPNLSNQTASFNPIGGGNLTTKSGYDAFLAKYDADGNYIWALGLGNTAGNTEERCWDIYVDQQGNSYICGGFSGTIDFNPLGIPNIKSIPSGVGLFLSKYNSSGLNQWAIVIDAKDTSVFYEAYTAVDLDVNGNIYFAGNFRGTNVNFNPDGSSLLSSIGQTDMFLSKYKTDGSFVWVKRIGGTLQDIVSPGALRVDDNGYPYFTGRIAGTVNFNTTGGTNNVSGASLFLASYDTSGAMRIAFGMPSNQGDGGHRVDFDSDNNVYISGWMNGVVDFDPTPNTYNVTATAPTADAFLAKYTNDGRIIWANSFGATNSSQNNIAAGLVVDQENNVIITGQLYGTNADFDPSPTSQLLLSSIGQNDCFIAKYDSSGKLWKIVTDIKDNLQILPDGLVLYQNYPNPFNPSTTISWQSSVSIWQTLKVYDVLGNEVATLVDEYKSAGVYEVNFDPASGNRDLASGIGYASGVYFYQLRIGDQVQTKKMILMR